MRYDVIVVGGGPAGSTTARECASLGLSVLMMDREEFPRDKPCGGGVTPRAAKLLPFDITPVVERTVSEMHLSVRQAKGFTRRAEEQLVYLTQRRNFDNFLAECAVKQGVAFRQKSMVRSIERLPTHVAVHTNNGTYEGSVLVAADGANGRTASMAGVDVSILHGIALEGNITPDGGFPQEWQDRIGLNFGTVPGGYGWLFPKGDHLNIGIGGWKYTGPTLREKLANLVRYYGFDPAALWGLRGYHLPVRQGDSRLADGNVILVGDAGGLLDPLTGEGIYAALWSGKASAKHIASYVNQNVPNLQGYQREVEQGLIPDLNASRRFHDIFNLGPSFYIALARRTNVLWEFTKRVLGGDSTYSKTLENHRVVATVVDFLSDLTRVNSYLQRRSGLRDPAPPQRFFLKHARNQ